MSAAGYIHRARREEPTLEPAAPRCRASSEDPRTARDLVQRAFRHVEQLVEQPESGSCPPEMRQSRYRQIAEALCRVFYRYEGEGVFVLYVMRGEMRFRKFRLIKRDRDNRNA